MSYFVTIRRSNPLTCKVDRYVARDEKGNLRAYGENRGPVFAPGCEVAEYLFHKEEIGTVEVLPDGSTRVEILTDHYPHSWTGAPDGQL